VWSLIKKWLFSLDAEKAHKLTVRSVRILGVFGFLLRWLTGTPSQKKMLSKDEFKALNVHTSGLDFQHALGLAAGFDKNAEMLNVIQALGFAAIEVGTVTPRPQSGNERPRLFRKPDRLALFNRMGFNNEGADRVAERISKFRAKNPNTNLRIGVNIGKNKDTSAADSAQDYGFCAEKFAELADYIVINVSSPNTPGLRDLQGLEALEAIVKSVKEALKDKGKNDLPVFLKLAPELGTEQLKDTIEATENWGISGYVLTNTWGGTHKGFTGGWSGQPVRDYSLRALRYARTATQKTIISVGGILTPEEAELRLSAGADLIQIYTGWIYSGPKFPSDIVRFLTRSKS